MLAPRVRVLGMPFWKEGVWPFNIAGCPKLSKYILLLNYYCISDDLDARLFRTVLISAPSVSGLPSSPWKWIRGSPTSTTTHWLFTNAELGHPTCLPPGWQNFGWSILVIPPHCSKSLWNTIILINWLTTEYFCFESMPMSLVGSPIYISKMWMQVSNCTKKMCHSIATISDLVSGFNPFEKYYIVKMDHFSKDRGENDWHQLTPKKTLRIFLPNSRASLCYGVWPHSSFWRSFRLGANLCFMTRKQKLVEQRFFCCWKALF